MDTEITRAIERMNDYLEDVEINPLPWDESHQAGFSIEWWDVIKSFEKYVTCQTLLLTKEDKSKCTKLQERFEDSKEKLKELKLAIPRLPE